VIATVGIPVRNGGALFERALAGIRGQRLDAEIELLVVDSGSSDGTVACARAYGARVIEIPPAEFGHGRTRNLIMAQASGSHVAVTTADAEPASADWLALLLGGFEQAADVALVYGPYTARPDAPPAVRLELERWFGSIPAGVERLAPAERSGPATALMGRRGFFSDVNACILRSAWEQVPYRDVSYAEDRGLALDMLRAGFAKVYEPSAAVVHSHDYTLLQHFGRSFDEARGIREVYGWREPASPRRVLLAVRGEVGQLRRDGAGPRTQLRAAAQRLLRVAGAIAGSRADRLGAGLQRLFSREDRVTDGAGEAR